MTATLSHTLTRRRLVAGAAAAAAGSVASALPGAALAQATTPLVGPLAPNPVAFKQTMDAFIGSATPVANGLKLDIPVLADNPGAVPVKASVTLPINDQDWCEEMMVVAELNPIPLACHMQFTADTGTAEAAVRLRLSQSQTVHVLARMKSGKLLAGKQMVTVAASGCGM